MNNTAIPGAAGTIRNTDLDFFDNLDAAGRIRWASQHFGDGLVLNSSFGPQSIVSLKLALEVDPSITVVTIELPGPEYRMQRLYRDYLKASLGFELHIVEAADMASKKSALCEFLQAHGARASLSGIRRQQTLHRAQKSLLEYDNEFPQILKIHPLADWSDAQIYAFIEALPAELRHPNYARGQRAIGGALLDAEQPKLECGLHL